MLLNDYVLPVRKKLFEDILAGMPPREGTYDEVLFREAIAIGKPQMGTVRYSPYQIHLEYIFSTPLSSAMVFTVVLDSPERIVFMPIPSWVVESIWQGEVSGTYRFESEALALLEGFRSQLEPEQNQLCFVPKQPVGRA